MSENISMNDDLKYNRATKMQLFLFSFNNLSTNFPYMVISSYLLYYAQSYLMLSAVVVGWIITGMRLFDGVTDPIIGWLIDNTDTKFGKFRPWMVIGNIIINVTFVVMFTMVDPAWSSGMKLLVFIGFYIIHILGYSMQTACTKGGGTVVTSDPQQRPILSFYYGSVGTVVVLAFLAYIPMSASNYELNMLDPAFWNNITWLAVILSFISMLLAVAGIWKKDVSENYRGFSTDKVKLKDFVLILKNNRAISMLVIAAATDKLAFAMAGAVGIYFYSNILLNQNLYGIISLLSLPFMIGFTVIGMRIAQKTTQKKAFVGITWFSLIVSALCILFWPEVGASVGSIGVIIYLVLYLLRTGASGVTGNIVITMISDCADYETYLTGKSVPGMMGTLFSFVDKLVSSINGLVIAGMFSLFGLANTVITPLEPATSYPGLVAITMTGILILPIIGYIASVVSMKFYPLDAAMIDEVKETIALYKENSEDPRHQATMDERANK